MQRYEKYLRLVAMDLDLREKGKLLSAQQVAETLGLESFRSIKPFLKTLPAQIFPPGKKRWYYEADVREAVEKNFTQPT